MEKLQVGDSVRYIDGGMVGKIIFISQGIATVKFSTGKPVEIALSDLNTMPK